MACVHSTGAFVLLSCEGIFQLPLETLNNLLESETMRKKCLQQKVDTYLLVFLLVSWVVSIMLVVLACSSQPHF